MLKGSSEGSSACMTNILVFVYQTQCCRIADLRNALKVTRAPTETRLALKEKKIADIAVRLLVDREKNARIATIVHVLKALGG